MRGSRHLDSLEQRASVRAQVPDELEREIFFIVIRLLLNVAATGLVAGRPRAADVGL